jgi:hypothetical protein
VRVKNFIPMKTGIILSSPLERVCPCKTSGKGGQGGIYSTITPAQPPLAKGEIERGSSVALKGRNIPAQCEALGKKTNPRFSKG